MAFNFGFRETQKHTKIELQKKRKRNQGYFSN